MSDTATAFSVLTSAATAKSTFRILPSGKFTASDGRAWLLTEDIANSLIRVANASRDDYPMDYEHQTIEAAKNGKPAPASGWFKKLEWRDDGLYVTDARWTTSAKEMINRQEYRYISPTFGFDPKTRAVRSIHSIALTNTPALSGLTDLAALRIESLTSLIQQSAASDVARMAASLGMTVDQFALGHESLTPVEVDGDRAIEANAKFVEFSTNYHTTLQS